MPKKEGSKTEGWKIEYDDSDSNSLKMTIGFHIALPKALTDPKSLQALQPYIQGTTPFDHKTRIPLRDEIEAFKARFIELVGKSSEDGAFIFHSELKQQLSTTQKEALDGVLTDDSLFSLVPSLLTEALKNTYDSVMIRIYLSSLSPEALPAQEPEVWRAMRENQIAGVTPVEDLDFKVVCLRTEENSTASFTDNGAGQVVLDAFKKQHALYHRTKIEGRFTIGAPSVLGDKVYEKGGPFSKLGMKIGGAGKGAHEEQKALGRIGAARIFEQGSDSTLGYKSTISWEPGANPVFSPSSSRSSSASPFSPRSPLSGASTPSSSQSSSANVSPEQRDFTRSFRFPKLEELKIEGGFEDVGPTIFLSQKPKNPKNLSETHPKFSNSPPSPKKNATKKNNTKPK